jgi:sarcosine oxidase
VRAAPRYDALVVGVGSMGSAALYHLARRGRRVLGLERFSLAHAHGSMHGATRIIRLAYHEHADYVPLLQRSYELWRELEQRSATPLLVQTGVVEVGAADGPLVGGTLRACAVHDLPHELLDAAELRRRLPAFAPAPGSVAVLQADGGYLHAERAVEAHAAQALAAGAELHLDERVAGWEAHADGVVVTTDRGRYRAERLVLTPGAWAPGLLQLPALPLSAERQVVAWFRPARRPELFEPSRLPVFIVEEDGCHHYGFPSVEGAGVKLGRMHHPGDPVPDPDAPRHAPTAAELEPLRAFLARRLPAAAGGLLAASACLFTNLPDRRFLIDLHPDHANVVVASVCSGHGFKFSPVVGEILAELACEGRSRHPAGFLSFERFSQGATP